MRTLAAAGLTLALSMGTSVAHQHHRDHHVHHHGVLPPYDVSTEETLEGAIEELYRWDRPGCSGCDDGLHAFIAGHDLEIHLGPLAYLEANGCRLREGEEVRITGSRLALRGGALLLARELHCGDHHVMLRDAKGRPLWREGR